MCTWPRKHAIFISFFISNCQEAKTIRPSKHFLLSKTSSRHLEDVFSVTLFVFQDVFKTYLRYVFLKRLQDVFKMCLQDVLQLCLQDVFKTSWKTKKCYTDDVFKKSLSLLQYVFAKTNVCWGLYYMFYNSKLIRSFPFY